MSKIYNISLRIALLYCRKIIIFLSKILLEHKETQGDRDVIKWESLLLLLLKLEKKWGKTKVVLCEYMMVPL